MILQDTDVVVIGAGAAGLVTALNATGRRVTVITPDCGEASTAASDLAQGGIAAAVDASDSPSLHVQDTLQAAQAEFDVPAVRALCREAPGAVAYLHSLGVDFARAANGWSLHTEAAHSRPRVLHVGDATGAAMMFALRRAVAEAAHIDVQPCVRAMSLLRDGEGICGVAALTGDGRQLAIRSRAIVIATGGIGGLFARSTNPLGARGEGIAMALAAGARCSGLEFVQFHPTALDVGTQPLPLLTEALRGAGARLIDDEGTRLMAGLHPLLELAPRDVVARAVFVAQQRGRRVLLDATRIDEVAKAFPTAHRHCREQGFDLAREPVPITSAQHYFMGGIAVDLQGRTSVPNLWAVGEAACTGAHGANRLASNSLLEAVVCGRRTGLALAREHYLRPRTHVHVGAMHSSESDSARELREIMWQCMGVVRTAPKIAEGLGLIARLREMTSVSHHLDQAVLQLAQHMLLSAARRTTSCGAHFRDDADAASVPLRPIGSAALFPLKPIRQARYEVRDSTGERGYR